jgi:hypothetical protein
MNCFCEMNGCSRRADPQLYGEQNHGYLVMGEDGGLLNPHDMMEHYGPVSSLCKYCREARLLFVVGASFNATEQFGKISASSWH